MQIHSPSPGQYGDIRRLLTDAFGQPDEAVLVERLRGDQAIAVELVLEQDGAILGHVALSWLSSSSAALALAPLAVRPARQCEGFGSDLIRESVAQSGALGADLIFVLGDPAYYGRFGFSVEAAAGFHCAYSGPHFLLLRLNADAAKTGRVTYPEAFAEIGATCLAQYPPPPPPSLANGSNFGIADPRRGSGFLRDRSRLALLLRRRVCCPVRRRFRWLVFFFLAWTRWNEVSATSCGVLGMAAESADALSRGTIAKSIAVISARLANRVVERRKRMVVLQVMFEVHEELQLAGHPNWRVRKRCLRA